MYPFDNSDDIRSIISERRIVTYFQPIVSMAKSSIIGVEALSRGVNGEGSVVYPPDALFKHAAEYGVIEELDRLCCYKALEAFSKLHLSNPGILLFINIDAAAIEKSGNSCFLPAAAECLGIPCTSIVIEINEARACDFNKLGRYIKQHRKKGFLIAMDDVGTGFSNLERLLFIKPDIIKIDREFIKEIHKHYCEKELIRSIISLSGKTGMLVIAEGVETEKEALCLMRLNSDMMQGYYYLNPELPEMCDYESCNSRISNAIHAFRKHMNQKKPQHEARNKRYENLAGRIAKKLEKAADDMLDATLVEFVGGTGNIETAYVLDRTGIQVSGTVTTGSLKLNTYTLINSGKKGDDHSLRDYISSFITSGAGIYTTDMHVSITTGSLCKTVLYLFKGSGGRSLILCTDFTRATGGIRKL